MSITTGSANSARYVDFDEYVDLKLQKTRSSIKSTDLLVALAGVAAMFLGYLLTFVVLDQWVIPGGFGVAFRWLLLLTLVAATVAWLVMKVGLPYMRSVNRLYAAREIEKADPSLKSSLLNLVDLRAAGREINASVMKTLERQAAVQLQQVDVTQVVDHRPLMRTASVLLAVIVLFCVYALLSPKDISNSIWRGLLPGKDVKLATSTEILNVLPGDVTVVARTPSSRVEIIADLGGVIPEKIFVHYTTSDGKFRDEPVELRADAEGQTRFKGVLVGETGQGLLQDVTYVVRAGDAESKTYRITVEQPPSATPDKVRLEFPGYMKLEPTEQAGGQIESWEGVKATLTAHTNIPVKSASIQFLDEPTAAPLGDDLPMTVSSDGRHLDAKWTLAFRSDGTSYSKHYRIQCKTASGAEDPAPIVYGIAIRPDLPPEIALLEPVRDLEAPANATIPLLIQARDPDFELSHINLHVEKLGQSILKDSLSDTKQSRVLLKHDLALDRLALNTGDVIEFWVEAFDNKQPRSNRRNTPRLKVTIIEPISDKAAKKQLADDRQQRDQRMAEAQQDQNDEGRPGQPPQQEVAANDPPRDPMPNEPPDRDPMPRDNAQPSKDETSGKDGKSGADGQGNSPPKEKSPRDPNSNSKPSETADGSGDNKTGDNKTKDGTKPPSDAPKQDRPKTDGTKQAGSQDGTNSRQSEQPTPLSPDGADDEKVIEKLVNNRKNREDSKSKDRKPDQAVQDANGSKEPTSNGDSPKSDMPPENEPDPKSKDTKPGENSTEQKSSKPNATKDSKTPSNDEPTTGDAPKEPLPKPGDAPKPSDSSVKPSPEKPARDQDKSDKPDSPKKNQPNKDRTNSEQTQPKEPMPGEAPAKPDEPDKNGPGTKDASKPSDSPAKQNENKGPQGADTPKNDTADEAAAPDKNKPDASNSDKSKPNEKTPGKSPNDKRPGAEDKPDPNAPPSKDTKKQPGETGQNAPREPAPKSPDAKPEPGDGKNKGPAKPQPDPKTKPTPQPGDAPQPDSKDKPNTRPGDPKPEDAPATNDATPPKAGDKKTSKQPQPGKQPNAAPNEQPPSEPGDKPPASKSPKKEQDSPTADEKQAPANKKDQKTNDSNNDGETGGDKPDQTGKPSPQKGPGEAGKQPGKQQPKDSSSKPSEDKQQPGQGSKPGKNGKPGDASDSKPSDGKSSSNSGKPGETGKPSADSSKPGDGNGGKEPADNQADKNKADKPAGPESDKAPSKPDDQPGQGDKPGDKPGDKGAGKSAESQDGGKSPGGKPSGKSGKGSSQPGKMSGQGGGSATPGKGGELPDAGSNDEAAALEEEAANLEYNKQATELVLKRLQKELERGDVDPELLEQLGWTEAEMKRFAERLGKHLEKSNAIEETPESAARREQFEEMLKTLDLKKGGTKRTGENSPQRDVNQIESRRTNVPPTYKKAFEQFTKDLNRQKQSKPAGSSK